jgi:hypothetical protein
VDRSARLRDPGNPLLPGCRVVLEVDPAVGVAGDVRVRERLAGDQVERGVVVDDRLSRIEVRGAVDVPVEDLEVGA